MTTAEGSPTDSSDDWNNVYGIYIAIAVAALLSFIIICLQCKIIYLQRVLIRKGIVGKSSSKSQQGQSSTSEPSQHVVESNPSDNILIEMTDVVTETDDNITSYDIVNGDTSMQEDFEESTTPGYDTVKKYINPSASKSAGSDSKESQNYPLKSPMGGLQYEDIEVEFQDGKKDLAHSKGPPCRMGYEDVDKLDSSVKMKTTPRVKMGYEDVDADESSQNQQKSSRFQIKEATTTQSKRQGKKGVVESPLNNPLPVYSVVNKPRKKPVEKKTVDDKKEDSASTLATYSVVNKPKKKKSVENKIVDDKKKYSASTLPTYSAVNKPPKKRKSSTEIVKSDPVVDISPNPPVINILGETEGNLSESTSMHVDISDVTSTNAGPTSIQIDDEDAPYKNVAASASNLQQPLYSNCREIEEINDSDLGDISSREPAPPPIPIRTYSVGWSDINAVMPRGGESDSSGKSCSPDRAELKSHGAIDSK